MTPVKKKRKLRTWRGWSVVLQKEKFMTPSVFFCKKDAVECKQTCGDGFEVVRVEIRELPRKPS